MGDSAEKELRYRIGELEKWKEDSEQVHKELLKRLHDKDVSDAIIRQQLDTLVKATSRIEGKIDQQQSVPAKRWNQVITTTISSVVSALVGAGMVLLLK